MSKLIPVFLLSLVFAFLAEKNSICEIDEFGNKKYLRKDKVFIITVTILMSVFVGLRTRYNDTGAYLKGYEGHSATDSILQGIEWLRIGTSPAFNFIQNVLRHLNVSGQSFLMIFAVATNAMYIWFIRKYTENIWLSIFLYSTMGCYTFTMAAIRQCVAVGICMIATDRAIQKRWNAFVFWVIIAALFHPYSIIYFVLPLLTFRPWSIRTFGMFGIFAVIGVGLQGLVGTLLDVTLLMGKEYDATSFSGDGVNIFRLAVIWSPIILSLLTRNYLQNSRDRAENLIINLSMLNASIMFVALFGTANYFARLANYFLIFQTIMLPSILKYFNKRSRQILYIVIVVCYFSYFYYANGIVYGGFDAIYDRITVIDYLNIVFKAG